MLDPVVVKASSLIILFGILFIPSLYLLRKKIFLEANVIVSSLLIAGVILTFFYKLDPVAYLEECSYIISTLAKETTYTFSFLPLFLLIFGLSLAYWLSPKLSRQTYRSFFHLVSGSFFLCFLLLSINLAFLSISLAITLLGIAEYLRKSEEDGKLSRFAKRILNPALKDGEFEGYMASLFFLIGSLVVIFFLPYNYALGCIAVLTFADPSATLIGRKFGKHRWRMNPDKTWEGSAALFFVAALSLVALDLSGYEIGLLTALIVALCCMLSESLPLKIGDNLIIPLLAGMVMLSNVSEEIFHANVEFWGAVIPIFFIMGITAYFSGMLTSTGSAVAVFFGILVFKSSGWPLLLSLLSFLIVGYILTRFKREIKKAIDSSHQERRTHNPVIANGMVPVFMGILFGFDPEIGIFLFSGALAAALADTAASEIGVLYPTPRMIHSFSKVRPGKRGAVSPLGELASIFGALFAGGIVITFLSIFGYPSSQHLLIAALLGGWIGCQVDSLLGASLGSLSKEEVNLFGTLVGSGVALIYVICLL